MKSYEGMNLQLFLIVSRLRKRVISIMMNINMPCFTLLHAWFVFKAVIWSSLYFCFSNMTVIASATIIAILPQVLLPLLLLLLVLMILLHYYFYLCYVICYYHTAAAATIVTVTSKIYTASVSIITRQLPVLVLLLLLPRTNEITTAFSFCYCYYYNSYICYYDGCCSYYYC